jgi:hypothetical protein
MQEQLPLSPQPCRPLGGPVAFTRLGRRLFRKVVDWKQTAFGEAMRIILIIGGMIVLNGIDKYLADMRD